MKKSVNIILILLISTLPQCYSNEKNFDVVTIKKDTIDIRYYSSKCIYVFSKSESCHDCYKIVNEIRNNLVKDYGIDVKLIAIAPLSSNNFNNTLKEYLQGLMSIDTIFFDIPLTNSNTNIKRQTSLFSRYKVEHCPSLLLINDENIKYISYPLLFSENDSQTRSTIDEIQKFYRQ